MKKNTKRLLLLLPAIAIIAVAGYFIFNSSSGPSSAEREERTKSMTALGNETKSDEELEKFVADSGYAAYENATNDSRVTYIKESGSEVTTKGKVTVKETIFYYQKDNSTEGKSANLIMEKNFEDVSYIISVDPENENTLLIEKKIYNENDGATTIHYEHYTYDVKEDKLTPKREDQNSMDYKEIKKHIDEYSKELKSLY